MDRIPGAWPEVRKIILPSREFHRTGDEQGKEREKARAIEQRRNREETGGNDSGKVERPGVFTNQNKAPETRTAAAFLPGRSGTGTHFYEMERIAGKWNVSGPI